ncbi:MAG: tetratricopeptide repeat protein [Gammaproteobacteria bacterium]
MNSLLHELRRRKVFRVAATYGVAAWLIVEISSVVLPTFNAPEWPMQAITLLAILGFPLAVALAWALEWTPEGIKPDREVDDQSRVAGGRHLNFALIGVLATALAASLALHLLDFGSGAGSAGGIAGSPGRSIAVLPFEVSSMSGETPTFLADGIQDDLLTLLARIESLKVISRTSVNEYRDSPKNVPTIGEELGVSTVLEGQVQRAGDNVRINVQLIDTATDAHLWAQSYDRRLTASNIFAIQSEIAGAIARELQATLSAEDQARLADQPTENLDAYLEYTVGKQEMDMRTSAALESAVEHFERAVELDPGYALAYVALADSYNLLNDYGNLSLQDMLEKAVPALAEAMKIDDRLAEAFTSLANLRTKQGDIEWAEPVYQRALELNPNYTTTYLWYGGLLRDALGRPEEALALHERGLELDPRSPLMHVNYASDLAALGRTAEARKALEHAMELDPQHPSAYATMASFHYLIAGEPGEAIRWLEKWMALDPGNPGAAAMLARIYMDLGDTDAARQWVEQAVETAPNNLDAEYTRMMLGLYLRDQAAAEESARAMLEVKSHAPLAMIVLAKGDLDAGRADEARERYAQAYPELLSGQPDVSIANTQAATDLALVLQQSGEREQADRLLAAALEAIGDLPPGSLYRPGYGRARALALQGRSDEALAALEETFAASRAWWWAAEVDPALESLRDEPQFLALMSSIRDDMEAARARLAAREPSRAGS